jgi:hypothetical protein
MLSHTTVASRDRITFSHDMGMIVVARDKRCRSRNKGGIRELEGSQRHLGKLSFFFFKLT